MNKRGQLTTLSVYEAKGIPLFFPRIFGIFLFYYFLSFFFST